VKANYDPGEAPHFAHKLVEDSFENKLNAKIADLVARGAKDIAVEYRPVSERIHAALIAYGGNPRAETYSADEAGAKLGVSGRLIRHKVQHGELPKVQGTGNRVRIPRDVVDRLARGA
jgi:excisionase family DNA binding protein